MKMTRLIAAVGAGALLAAGAVLGVATSASADDATPTCVPSPGSPGTPDTFVADGYIKWNWTGGQSTPQAAPPGDGWHSVGATNDIKGQTPDAILHNSKGQGSPNGHDDYFYFQTTYKLVPGTPAVPPTTCPPSEPGPGATQCTVTSAQWYTESDDAAPELTPAGYVFTTTGANKAVGLREAVSQPLKDWTSLSFTTTGDTSQFFFRIVIDTTADGGTDYQSLSFPGYTTIDQSSQVYQFPGETLADVAKQFPNATITSIGFQTNSKAEQGLTTTLTSVQSGCGGVNFVQPADKVATKIATGAVSCEAQTVETTITTTTTHYSWVEGSWVEGQPQVSTETEPVTATAEQLADCPAVVTVADPPSDPTDPATPAAATGNLADTGSDIPLAAIIMPIVAAGIGAIAIAFTAIRRRRVGAED